jgi:enoyl-CoA hydratase/carnithine racemase
MKTVNVDIRDNIAVIELNRPKAHALNKHLVTDLQQTIIELGESDRVEGAILTAKGTIFSAGLDVVELYGYDEDQMDAFWEDFGRLLRDLVGFPKPLVAAINGHAPAGGCVLAMCCDYRFMAEGQGRIGLNEVPVGIVIPKPIVELARHVMGDIRAADMIFHGALLFAEQAGAYGLVHATVPPEQLMESAEQKLQSWLALPQEPWRDAKAVLRAPLLNAMDIEFSDAFGATIRHWWSAESRATVAKMIEKLKSRA